MSLPNAVAPRVQLPEESTAPLTLDGRVQAGLVVPYGDFIIAADYARDGTDLVLTSNDGTTVIVSDYFATETPPALLTGTGGRIPPELATKLAGTLAPAQYAQAAPAVQAPPIGREATATRADGTRVTLAQNDPIFSNDVVETGAGSKLGIIFTDKTTFALSERARMVLDELIYDPANNNFSSVTSLLQGAFVIVTGEIAKLKPEAVVINTPAAQIGIRGTHLATHVENGAYTLLKGGIILTNAVATLELTTPGDTTIISGFNAAPSVVFNISPSQFAVTYGDADEALQDTLENLPRQDRESIERGVGTLGQRGEVPGEPGVQPEEAGEEQPGEEAAAKAEGKAETAEEGSADPEEGSADEEPTAEEIAAAQEAEPEAGETRGRSRSGRGERFTVRGDRDRPWDR